VALVRAGSARHRKPPVQRGHQRSRSAHENRRSHRIHCSDLERRNGLATGSSPSSGTHLARSLTSTFPQGRTAAGSDGVLVGRIRADLEDPNAVLFWSVADNLRKGAALNAVQIAEVLLA
jgi:aspartate-semialdehyde dehydrogenase